MPEIPQVDVLVPGSGAAGLALAGARRPLRPGGRQVALAGRHHRQGRAAACGCRPITAWARSARRPAEEALTYIRSVAPKGWAETEDALWQSYVQAAPAMLKMLEAETPLHHRRPGARSLCRVAGRQGAAQRRPRRFRLPLAFRCAPSYGPAPGRRSSPTTRSPTPQPPRPSLARDDALGWRAAWRRLTGRRAMGQGLTAGLLAGCHARAACSS